MNREHPLQIRRGDDVARVTDAFAPARIVVVVDPFEIKLEKAHEFLLMAEVAVENDQWDAGVSLAVSAGINAADALTLARTGRYPRGRSHDEIVSLLRKCGVPGDALLRHIRELLRVKNKAQYSTARCTAREAADALRHAQRTCALSRHGTQKG